MYHFTESRVRGHVAICVLAATIEAVMGKDLAAAKVHDPDIKTQPISARRALAELDRIRRATVDAGARSIRLVTRRNGLQAQILKACGIETSSWDRADII